MQNPTDLWNLKQKKIWCSQKHFFMQCSKKWEMTKVGFIGIHFCETWSRLGVGDVLKFLSVAILNQICVGFEDKVHWKYNRNGCYTGCSYYEDWCVDRVYHVRLSMEGNLESESPYEGMQKKPDGLATNLN